MPTSRKQDRRKTHPSKSSPPLSSATQTRPERRVIKDRRQKEPFEFMSLFASIPSHLACELIDRCTIAEFNRGDTVLSLGQKNDSILILLSGHLKVLFGDDMSTEFIIINPGECIGEMSIIDGKPVSAHVVAESDCRIFVMHHDEFWRSMAQIPGLARNLLTTLSERMRNSNQAVLRRLQAQMELEHLQKELMIASNIQSSLLPSHSQFPQHNKIDIFFLMRPAKNVGGDFYDAFFVAPNKLFIAVGDVSGKGIAAALFMVQSIMHLRTQALLDFPPNEILERVNNSLCKNNTSSMFVTIFCGILDTETGYFEYSNGGHNPPLTNAITGHFEFMPIPQGILVGFMEDIRYKSASLYLKPGDTLFVYTDGVTEAENRQKVLFSDDKLIKLLATSNGISAQKMVELVEHEINTFAEGADQSDDITMLAVRFLK